MYVLNESNLNIIEGTLHVRPVMERYETVKCDLPKETVKRLLRDGQISREVMLRSWLHITPEEVEKHGIELMSRGELWALTQNPKIARLALKYPEVVETLGDHALGNAYDHITIEEAEEYDVELRDVISNSTVSVEVKRSLINKEFQAGNLPVKHVDELRKYVQSNITTELVTQLEQINYPERLIDPSLLERPALRKFNDLGSRLLLVLCGCYDRALVERMFETELEQLSVIDYCVGFKGPSTVTESSRLLDDFSKDPAAIKYLSAKGYFNDVTLKDIITAINKYGDSSDMVTLYENNHLTVEQQRSVHKHVSTCIELGNVRRGLFDTYIMNASKSQLDEFCASWSSDPAMMFMITTPRAYKVVSLHCISRIDPDAVSAYDIISKCHGETFTDHEADVLLTQVLNEHDDDLVTRFVLMSGIPTKSQNAMIRCVLQSHEAA